MKVVAYYILFLSVASLIACTKGGVPVAVNGNMYDVMVDASSKQLVPAIDTTSTGTLKGNYDEATNIFTYTITWTDLWRDTRKDTISSISFYGPATAGVNGNLIRRLPVVNTNRNGTANLGLAGNTGFSQLEQKDFLAGNYYFTINTRRYPAGIVRGQLVVTKK